MSEPTLSSPWHFACKCGAECEVRIRPGDSVASLRQQLADERGWVLELLDPADFRFNGAAWQVRMPFAYCSMACHNEVVRDRWQSYHDERYWGLEDGEQGPKPACTCPLEMLGDRRDGRLRIRRAPTCPWHEWLRRRRAARDRAVQRAYEAFKDVPLGTHVVERRGVRPRGHGVTAGAPRLLTTSSGALQGVVPCEGWRPHASLLDLDLAEDEG